MPDIESRFGSPVRGFGFGVWGFDDALTATLQPQILKQGLEGEWFEALLQLVLDQP